MNPKRRAMIGRLMFWVLSIHSYCLRFISYVLRNLGELSLTLTRRRNHHRVEALQKAVEHLTQEYDPLIAEFKGGPLTATRRQYLLARKSVLDEESQRVQIALSEMKQGTQVIGTVILLPLLTSLQGAFRRRKQKNAAFARIISQAESSPTFYWDLALWLVIPGAYSEELMGDLAEEYMLRSELDDEARARAWYQEQVIRTICGHLWRKIERLAAIGTLIDFVYRLFRK